MPRGRAPLVATNAAGGAEEGPARGPSEPCSPFPREPPGPEKPDVLTWARLRPARAGGAALGLLPTPRGAAPHLRRRWRPLLLHSGRPGVGRSPFHAPRLGLASAAADGREADQPASAWPGSALVPSPPRLALPPIIRSFLPDRQGFCALNKGIQQSLLEMTPPVGF